MSEKLNEIKYLLNKKFIVIYFKFSIKHKKIYKKNLNIIKNFKHFIIDCISSLNYDIFQ